MNVYTRFGLFTVFVLFVSSSFSQTITYGSGYSGPICGEEVKSNGAYYTGEYRNLFVDVLGKTEADVNAKIEKAWKHFFTPGASTTVYYEVGDDMAYILDVGNNDVRTEGQSYGMMISVQLDKKTEFDKLWRWAKKYMQHKTGNWKGYFAWQCKPDGTIIDNTCAPDGEEYFVTALFLASNRWGNDGEIDYNADAQYILKSIMSKTGAGGIHNMYNSENHTVVFAPNYDNVKFSDPSYCLPGFMELWAMWADENNEFWSAAAVAARDLLRNSCHEETGLFPDYSQFDGTPYNPNWPNMSYDTRQYKFDAIRCAMNVGMDYNWFRSDSANQAQMMTRLMSFFKSDNYRHAYFDWDGGNPEGTYNEGMAGANGAGCIAVDDKELATGVLKKLWNTNPPSGQWRYFNGMVYFLGLLNASGNFRVYKPMPENVIDTVVNESYNGVTYSKSTTFSYNEGCKIYRVHVNVPTTKIDNVNDWGLNLYPNPANKIVTIDCENEFVAATIYNSSGTIVKSSLSNQIDVSDLGKGLYVVSITLSDNSQKNAKLVIN